MSTLKVDSIQDTSGNDQYTAKAWINFNGTGTIAINDSGNVSSITDVSTGTYTVTFDNSMSSANYSLGQIAQISSWAGSGHTGFTTSIEQNSIFSGYITVYTASYSAGRYDCTTCALNTFE